MATLASQCLVDVLATSASLKCLNPNSQNTFQNADVVALMDDELRLNVNPDLKAAGQGYFVYNVDQTIVQGQSAYTFPTRAIGNAVRDVVLLDASGNEVALNNLERSYIKVQFPFNYVPSIWSFGQYVTGNEVNLYNTLIQSYTAYKLRFITERRPGMLTLSTNCGQVTVIAGNNITVGALGDGSWTTASTFDIINQLPPFQSRGDDLTVSNINTGTNVITFNSVPSGLAVGDWVCLAGTACIPQIPYDWFPLLKEYTIATMAQALDMSQLLAASNAKIEKFKSNAMKIARPRVADSPKVIINKDAFGSRGFGGIGGAYR